MFRYIEPEVPGGFGDKTQLDTSVHPPIVQSLDCCFDGWLGDCILEVFPCFIITEEAKDSIENLKLTGISFDSLTVTTSEVFNDLHPDKDLPHAYWAKINGIFGVDDFGLADDFRLVISELAFKVLVDHKLNNAIISDIE